MIQSLILRIASNALGLYVAALIVNGVTYKGWLSLVIAGAVIGLVNFFVKPIISLLSLPIIFVTFGIFLLVINALLLLLASAIVPDFYIDGFVPALLTFLIMYATNLIVTWIFDFSDEQRV